jgi:hypothetical protein
VALPLLLHYEACSCLYNEHMHCSSLKAMIILVLIINIEEVKMHREGS